MNAADLIKKHRPAIFCEYNKILMSHIAQPHTQIVNDVDPLPAAGTGDDIHTVQLVIEYTIDI